MKKINKKGLRTLLLCVASCCIGASANAQHFFNNPISQYYRDGYLWNPALAGQNGTRLYGLLNTSWSGFEGAPKLVTFAGDAKLGEKSGVGLIITSDKSGIFQRYQGAASYAFVAKLSEKNSLRIGGSLNFYKERLDNSALTSNGQIDNTAKTFNDKGMQFNGDLGLSFEGERFSIGATGYNIGSYMQDSAGRSSDLAMGQVLASYKFNCEDERISVKPMAAYKMFYDQKNVFTGGLQLEMQDAFHASVYWQSTGNVMGGLGIMAKNLGEINFFYSSKNKYNYNQQYEVALKVNIK
ncbi:PorP/SprF family type IX secretion system membrane protein [Pinibacter soli]|uniref:PorP/SprF family type IX secretion system membrane protein n=1 Tax=Pinibacter soli TaxID=3044211 RepID=A0ABT6RBE2_9BACT|nr:PorP/SprF family type IX secretion system membrane protein [Pinibacter soli]MDI3319217.1 PorP/SprF family type IX secretion system membrane protein [Pinibacter soli]